MRRPTNRPGCQPFGSFPVGAGAFARSWCTATPRAHVVGLASTSTWTKRWYAVAGVGGGRTFRINAVRDTFSPFAPARAGCKQRHKQRIFDLLCPTKMADCLGLVCPAVALRTSGSRGPCARLASTLRADRIAAMTTGRGAIWSRYEDLTRPWRWSGPGRLTSVRLRVKVVGRVERRGRTLVDEDCKAATLSRYGSDGGRRLGQNDTCPCVGHLLAKRMAFPRWDYALSHAGDLACVQLE